MWLNDTYGDCVSAEECFAKSVQPGVFITDATLLAFCQKNNLLNGAELYDVLELMQANGFQQDGHTYDDGNPLAVDWTNRETLTNAISIGPVKIGVAAAQLENVAQNTPGYPVNGTLAVGFTQDSNLDHCVSLCGFGPLSWLAEQLGTTQPGGVDGTAFGYALFTWSAIWIIDEQSMLNITGEAWLREVTTIIK